MKLWVDKYRPTDLSNLDYHKAQAENLKKLTHEGDFPHLLVHGPSGAGKKTRIMCLLKELYGSGVERLRMEHMNFTTPSNKKLEIMTISSNYHIEVDPSDVGIYDRIVVMDLIKQIAQTSQLDATGQREFKVVVLVGVDDLTKDAQHALRRTMEKYIANCRLILCANSISRITPAIRSRCLGIRVPAPTLEEITKILQNTCSKEGLSIPPAFALKIAEKSDRNLRRALLLVEACKVAQYPFTVDQIIPDLDWMTFTKDVAKNAVEEQSAATIGKLRKNLYEIIIHGIPINMIFEIITSELFKICDNQLKGEIASLATLYEYRARQGNKAIVHIEAFIAKFMCIYKQFMENIFKN